MASSTMQPASDASFVDQVQSLINADKGPQHLFKNQLFQYSNPYPQNLPQLDSDKYNVLRVDSSDIHSPKQSKRNTPLRSDGHRVNFVK